MILLNRNTPYRDSRLIYYFLRHNFFHKNVVLLNNICTDFKFWLWLWFELLSSRVTSDVYKLKKSYFCEMKKNLTHSLGYIRRYVCKNFFVLERISFSGSQPFWARGTLIWQKFWAAHFGVNKPNWYFYEQGT